MELEDDLRVVGNNMKQLEISEQEVKWRVGEKERERVDNESSSTL